jgi:predicted membrane-bound spermidine synthase
VTIVSKSTIDNHQSLMSAKLSVIFYIILCLEIGLVLTLLPWIPQGTLGLSDWGNNYFLLYAARKTGLYSLQTVVASGWVRGAVTGIGILNLGIAFWEIFHFNQSVRALQASATESNVATTPTAARLPNHERRDDKFDGSRQ